MPGRAGGAGARDRGGNRRAQRRGRGRLHRLSRHQEPVPGQGGKLARVRTRAVAGTTTACFALAPGYYPIAIYHDANGDRDFNRTLFAPKEGFGFSNDAPATFALPPFEKVRIKVGPGPTTIRIRMRYP